MFKADKLVIRGLNWIGDAIMSLPTIWAIRDAMPATEITVLSPGWCADIYRMCPAVDHVLEPVKGKGSFGSTWKTGQLLKEHGFDSAILLPNSSRSAWEAYLAKIPRIYGYSTDGRTFLLSNSLKLPQRSHTVLYYQHLLEKMDIEWPVGKEKFELDISDETKAITDEIFATKGIDPTRKIIGYSPGAAWGPSKRWPAENFAGAVSLLGKDSEHQSLFFGSLGDVELIREIEQQTDLPIISLAGEFDQLHNLVDAISRCDVLITNDSGPMHIAAAVEVPVLALFGPTDEGISGPWTGQNGRARIVRAPDCQPCYNPDCKSEGKTCMSRIEPELVVSIAKELLE